MQSERYEGNLREWLLHTEDFSVGRGDFCVSFEFIFGKNQVKFVGETKFAPGEWIGVELDTPGGKNNGSVDGVKYFSCAGRFGRRE